MIRFGSRTNVVFSAPERSHLVSKKLALWFEANAARLKPKQEDPPVANALSMSPADFLRINMEEMFERANLLGDKFSMIQESLAGGRRSDDPSDAGRMVRGSRMDDGRVLRPADWS